MKKMLLAQWNRASRWTGPQGVMGFALALAAVGIAIGVMQLQAHQRALRVAVSAKSLELARLQRTVGLASPMTGDPTQSFVGAFPPLSHNTADLETIFQSAGRSNIALVKGEYHIKQDAASPLVTYSLSFPVSANYPATKKFAAEVLRELPNAALEELRMNRNSSESKSIDSVIRFSLIYQQP